MSKKADRERPETAELKDDQLDQSAGLFDEADALFGKRTQVKSSNDRFSRATRRRLRRLWPFKR